MKKSWLFIIGGLICLLPFSCKNESSVDSLGEQTLSKSFDEKELGEFTDYFTKRLELTKSEEYSKGDVNQKLEILLENTGYNQKSFQSWAKSLNLTNNTIANARTSGNSAFTDEQKIWISKLEAETTNSLSKEEYYKALDKFDEELKNASFKSDKTPILIAVNVARSTVEKAFEQTEKETNTPNGRTTAKCGFLRWTCIVTTTAVIGALGYIAGGVVGGGILAVAAYDIAKCCICCPDSCSNSWFCYFNVPISEEMLIKVNHFSYT